MKLRQRRFRHLLTTVSAAAMIVGLSAEANAACSIFPASTIGGVAGPGFPNSTSIDCVQVTGVTIGNLVNNPTGTIRNEFGAGPTATTHAIAVIGTLSGSIQNSGSVTAELPGGAGPQFRNAVLVEGVVTGNITNNGAMKAFATQTALGILSNGGSISGGIINSISGLISGVANRANSTTTAQGIGIELENSVVFPGGILNAGTIVGFAQESFTGGTGNAVGIGIQDFESSFTGGITSTGTIIATASVPGATRVASVAAGIVIGGPSKSGAVVGSVSFFSGGITNTGLMEVTSQNGAAFGVLVNASTFLGGITNSGKVTVFGQREANGIYIAGDNAVSTFSGGITNSGQLLITSKSESAHGIYIDPIQTFVGNVVNSGTITAVTHGSGNTAVGMFVAANTLIGNIVNSGSIQVNSGDTGFGIYASVSTFSGGITNSGSIGVTSDNSNAWGIYLTASTFTGGITNSGTLAAVGKTDAFGIYLPHVRTFFGGISNSGLLTVNAQSTAIGIYVNEFSTFVGGITNSGTILVTGGVSDERAAGIYVADAGTFSGNIVNSGKLVVSSTGGGTAGAWGIYVGDLSTFLGGITNSGTIIASARGSGGAIGIYLEGGGASLFSGGITNTGLMQINSDNHAAGIYVEDSELTFLGGISNSGTINVTGHDGTDYGIAWVPDGGTLSGGITNSGLINVSANDGKGFGIYDFGSRQTVFSGDITNSGTIHVSSDFTAYGIYATSISTFLGGITNSGTIIASSNEDFGYGIYLREFSTVTGGIANHGLISVSALDSAAGIYVFDGRSFNGGISNSGNIAVTNSFELAAGIYVDEVASFLGGISNSGKISVSAGTGNAIGIFDDNFSILVSGGISNSGLIDVTTNGDGASAFGIYLGGNSGVSTFIGGITNSGTILASAGGSNAFGIYVNLVSSWTGDIVNSGLIKVTANSYAAGILVTISTFSGGISNTGTIIAQSHGSDASGVHVHASTFIGGISNSGLIKAVSDPVVGDFAIGLWSEASTFIGGISNSGTIIGEGGTNADGLAAGAPTFIGNITNSGTIIAIAQLDVANGMHIDDAATFSGGITNSGLVSATALGADSAVGIYLNAGTFTGGITNSGTVFATAANSKGYGIFASVTTFSGGITNSGKIVGSGVTGYGIYTSVSTFLGDITNSGLIAGHGTVLGRGFGIYLDPLTFSGNVNNTGTIIGMGGPGSAAIEGSQVANSFTVFNGNGVTGGTILGNVVLSDTVADSVIVNQGLLKGGITGALASATLLAGTIEVPLKSSIGAGSADGGTPINAFTMTGGNLQLDVTPNASRPDLLPLSNGHISAQTINVTGGNFVVGVQAGVYQPTTIYRDVIVGNVAASQGTNFVTNFAHVFTTSGVLGATLLADDAGPATDPTVDPPTTNTEDLKLTFIGFGKGFVFNGAGPNLGETPNEKSAGGGVNGLLALPPGTSATNIAAANTLLGALFPLSGRTLLGALDQLGGAQYADDFNLMSGSPIFTSDSVQTVLWARGGGGNTLASARLGRDGMQVASAGQVLTDAGQQTAQLPMGGPSADRFSVWGRGYGVFTNVDNQTSPNVVPGYKENRYGGIIGADYSFNDHWLVGLVGNYSHDTADFKQGAGNTKVNNYLFGLYGQFRQGPWYVNAIGSGGWGDYTSIRNISSPIPAIASSSYSGQNWGVYGEGGWDLPVSSFKLTPFIGLGYLHQNIDQFTETGAGSEDLTLKGTSNSLQTSLGVRASTNIQMGNGWLIPEVRAIWQHEFMDQQQSTTDAFAINPGTSFQIRGPMISRETGVFGGGLTYTINPSAKVFVDYDFKANSDFTSHQVSAGLKWTFGAAAPPPPPPAPPPVPPQPVVQPPPAQAQTFVVYFDFDKSVLTPEAMGIIQQASAAYKQTGAVNIKVDGYTDLAGTAKYNVGLSKRRADAVRAELVKDGVPNNSVTEAWHGKDNPAVPTPDGVREPRNRRATIMLP